MDRQTRRALQYNAKTNWLQAICLSSFSAVVIYLLGTVTGGSLPALLRRQLTDRNGTRRAHPEQACTFAALAMRDGEVCRRSSAIEAACARTSPRTPGADVN